MYYAVFRLISEKRNNYVLKHKKVLYDWLVLTLAQSKMSTMPWHNASCTSDKCYRRIFWPQEVFFLFFKLSNFIETDVSHGKVATWKCGISSFINIPIKSQINRGKNFSFFLTEKNNGGTFLKALFLTCYKPDRRHFIISFRLVLISKTEMTIL